MSALKLRTAWMSLGMSALVMSAFAFGRTDWGDVVVDFLGGQFQYIGLAILVAAPITLATERSPMTLASIMGSLHLTGIASQASLDWVHLAGWINILPARTVSPWETTTLVMVSALLFTVGYRVASEIEHTTFEVKDLESEDRDAYVNNSGGVLLRVVGGATVATLITMLVAYALSARPLSGSLSSWPVVIFGLLAVGLVSVVVYSLRLAWAHLATVDESVPADFEDEKVPTSTLLRRLDGLDGDDSAPS